MNDLRFAVRQLARNPGFTAVAVLTLALGIGANTAVFSLLNAVLLRPLPFHEPERLVWIANPDAGDGLPGLTRRSNFIDWRESIKSFEGIAAYVGFSQRIGYTMTEQGEPKRLEGIVVTDRFLETLGVTPALGRGFVQEECLRNGPRAILITDRFWRQEFRSDAGLVGKSITINNTRWPVVGILPKSFDFSDVFTPGARAADFVRPFQDAPGYENWGNMMAVLGRLKPGVTLASAQAEFDLMNHQLHSAHPERGTFGARLTFLRERVSGSFRRSFTALAGAAFCVLLIACANLSNLVLARGASRGKELAVRVALGAARSRLVRQLLTENLLLTISGALVALLVAFFTTKLVATSGVFAIPLLHTARLDHSALAFTALMALGAGLASGLLPALQLSQTNPQEDLKQCASGVIRGFKASRLRQGLVAAQVALAFVLLIASGLLLRSLARLLEVNVGFRPAQAASWRLAPNREFLNHQQETSYYEELVNRVQALPGVESATLASTLPFELNDLVRVHAKGESKGLEEGPKAFLREVGAMNYFKAMGISLRTGRDFDSHDAAAVPKPIIINETMARQFFPNRNAVDQILVLASPPDPLIDCKIVAVVADVPQSSLEQAAGPEMYMFNWGGRQLVVRSSSPLRLLAPAIRGVLREFNPAMAVTDFAPLQDAIDRLVSPKRLVLRLIGLFSVLALLLAAIGIYGVVSYSVNQRTREIGLRLALGSQYGAVLRLVMLDGMSAVAIGCTAGLGLSFLLARAAQALLFGVSAADPLTLLSSAGALLSVGFCACCIPAWRAAKIDPIQALKYE